MPDDLASRLEERMNALKEDVDGIKSTLAGLNWLVLAAVVGSLLLQILPAD